MTTRACLQATLADRLGSAVEARWIAEEVLGSASSSEHEVGDAEIALLSVMAERRAAGEPLQYVLGSWAFRALELGVDRRALIPRPETEQVVEIAIAELRHAVGARRATSPATLADLGTGTGAIALAISAELGEGRPDLRVWATDAQADALELAGENLARVARAHPWVARQVRTRRGRWFGALPAAERGRLDLVVANPPYVSEEEWESLDAEVRLEPRSALVAGRGTDGTPGFADVETVVSGAREWLMATGVVVVELAPAQAAAAAELAGRLGYRHVRIERDLAGRDRAVVARR